MFLLSAYSTHAPIKAKGLVFKGYCGNDRNDWKNGISELNIIHEANPDDGQALFDLIQSQYGYIGYCIAREDDGVDDKIDDTLLEIQKLSGMKGFESHAEALRGAMLAMKIGLKPLRAFGLGPKSEKALKHAVELAPENPLVWVEMGNMKYHAPGLFGGSNTEAITCFKKAIALYNETPELKSDNWQYLHSLAWLGKAYEEEELYGKAVDAYEKALEFAPDFSWVKNELLPAAKKK